MTLSIAWLPWWDNHVLGQANTAATAKSGYVFDVIDLSGSGSSAQFGAIAVPATTSGIAASGTRRFAISHVGVIRGDQTLSAPSDVAAINAMPVLGN